MVFNNCDFSFNIVFSKHNRLHKSDWSENITRWLQRYSTWEKSVLNLIIEQSYFNVKHITPATVMEDHAGNGKCLFTIHCLFTRVYEGNDFQAG